jgi:hypothetical protein
MLLRRRNREHGERRTAERLVTALIGAGIGLPLGVLLAAAVTHALSRFGVTFAVSVPSLITFTVVADAGAARGRPRTYTGAGTGRSSAW